jgi:thioredoxin
MKIKSFIGTIAILLLTVVFANAQKPEFLTEATFKQKVHDFDKNQNWKYLGNTPAIVDFYADWCRPCRSISPILEELASEYGVKLKVYKVNTDNNQRVANAFNIRSIPSILFITASGEHKMIVGAGDKSDFENEIKNYLKVTK